MTSSARLDSSMGMAERSHLRATTIVFSSPAANTTRRLAFTITETAFTHRHWAGFCKQIRYVLQRAISIFIVTRATTQFHGSIQADCTGWSGESLSEDLSEGVSYYLARYQLTLRRAD